MWTRKLEYSTRKVGKTASEVSKALKIPKKTLGYTAVLVVYAKEEGYITNLTGIKKVQELKSLHKFEVNKKIGEKAVFAKNGGKSIYTIILFNKNESSLLADIRRTEQSLEITTSTKALPKPKKRTTANRKK